MVLLSDSLIADIHALRSIQKLWALPGHSSYRADANVSCLPEYSGDHAVTEDVIPVACLLFRNAPRGR